METQNLRRSLENRLANAPVNLSIVSPDQKLPPSTQADWLISLLVRMYVSHGITKNPNQVADSISSGDCRCWFVTENGSPVASAALIRQKDGSEELGRAVSVRNGAGSLVMLSAALNHLENSPDPLVAEVRIAAEFQGIPSGEATQAICFKHLQLAPHALLPAFNHGAPVRQEQFLFSSDTMLEALAPATLPSDSKTLEALATTAISLAANGFFSRLVINFIDACRHTPHWEVMKSAPFSVLTPTSGQTSLETAIKEAEAHTPFILVPLEATAANAGALIECLNQGFTPCGFDRNLAPSGRPIIFLGKLKPDTTLAPIKIIGDFLNPAQQSAIHQIDSAFRKTLKSC